MLRSADSLGANEVIIKDPKMEPFFIAKNTSTRGFSVYETVVKQEKKTGQDKTYIRLVCYPSTFSSALKTVAESKLDKTGFKYETIKEYIKEYDKIKSELVNLTEL